MEYTVIFWDMRRNRKSIRYVKGLLDVRGTSDMCCILSKVDGEDDDAWKLELCNTIGSPLDMKLVNVEPMFSGMSKTHVAVANNDYVYLWQYRNQVARLTTFESTAAQGIRKLGREIAWFIDDSPDVKTMYDRTQFSQDSQTDDIIGSICLNENMLLVGRISGTVMRFSLPHLSPEQKQFLQTRPNQLAIVTRAFTVTIPRTPTPRASVPSTSTASSTSSRSTTREDSRSTSRRRTAGPCSGTTPTRSSSPSWRRAGST